jgi:hypothetical protein
MIRQLISDAVYMSVENCPYLALHPSVLLNTKAMFDA